MMDSAEIIFTIAMMACITVPFVGLIIFLYWLMVGSRLPPNIKKLREKRDVAGLKKALNYLNLDRDFWSVRRAAVQALEELSLAPGDTTIAARAVEALLNTLHGRDKQIDPQKIASRDDLYTYPLGKIPVQKYVAYCRRIEQVRELAAKTLRQIGTETQDVALRSRITEELIAVLEKGSDSPKELCNAVAATLEAMTGQRFGLDYEMWSAWWRERRR